MTINDQFVWHPWFNVNACRCWVKKVSILFFAIKFYAVYIAWTQGFLLNNHDRGREIQTRRRLLRALVQSIKSFESNALAFDMKILRCQKLQAGEKGRERERKKKGFLQESPFNCAGHELSGILASCQMWYQLHALICFALATSHSLGQVDSKWMRCDSAPSSATRFTGWSTDLSPCQGMTWVCALKYDSWVPN